MTTPTTPEQALAFAQSIFDDGAPDDEVELIRSLADQVEALTAERDAWRQAHDGQVAKRDIAVRKLAALSNAHALEDLYQVSIGQERKIMALEKERDALKDSARLALDALKAAQWKSWRTDKAIDALEAVL